MELLLSDELIDIRQQKTTRLNFCHCVQQMGDWRSACVWHGYGATDMVLTEVPRGGRNVKMAEVALGGPENTV